MVGTAEDDLLTENEADNSLSGGIGDDVLRGREGNDILLDGEGRDAAYYEGNQTQYTPTIGSDTTTVTDRSGEFGTDSLTSIELLDFEIDGAEGNLTLEKRDGIGGLSAEDLESFI